MIFQCFLQLTFKVICSGINEILGDRRSRCEMTFREAHKNLHVTFFYSMDDSAKRGG